MKKFKHAPHKYRHIKDTYPDKSEQAYQDGLKLYNSWSVDEREKKGFCHAHPRRLYIFLGRYLNEIKYFMDADCLDKYVLPWICATHSERRKSFNRQMWFKIKQLALYNAVDQHTIYKLEKIKEKYKK